MNKDDILRKIVELNHGTAADASGKRLLVAIDGRCGAGKTTLAGYLQEQLEATVFHTDDFFLRPEQRTPERWNSPGENVDHERFLAEVLEPLRAGVAEVPYRRFDCRTQSMQAAVLIRPGPICIVEGSYSCHPSLWDYYDCRIFMTVSAQEQRARIGRRNGAMASMYENRWIPLEEDYFSAFRIEERCDWVMDTSGKARKSCQF